MKFTLFSIIIAFLTVVLVAAHAALPPEIYWKSMLPNTPMPELLKDLLHPTVVSVNVGNSGGGTTVHGVRGNNEKPDRTGDLIPRDYNRNYNIKYNRGGSPNVTEFLCNSTATIFFLEKDLKAGHKINLPFMHTSNHASFLPRQVVKSIPFSSSKMAEILERFNVERGSGDAAKMKMTIEICEAPGVKREERYCATSLESMVDFVALRLGKSVKALSMGVINQTKEEEYTIIHGVKRVGDTQVVCHKLNYVYAVFLCHKIENTIAYTVLLQGADGSRMKALFVCHRDTSSWNPKHFSFQILKVKPGTVPICHFLAESTVVWLPKQN